MFFKMNVSGTVIVLGVLSSVLGMVVSDDSERYYRIRRRSLNIYDHLRSRSEQILTHSDDGRSKNLPAFYLDIFETNGDLTRNGEPILRMAMNKFLLAELNAIYTPENNEIKSVGSAVIGAPSAIPPSSGRRILTSNSDKMGTTMMMEVEVTFDNEPSPKSYEVDIALRQVMSNLTYFVTNLTAFGVQEFFDVNEAYRREIPTRAPTPAPNADAMPVSGIQAGDNDSDAKIILKTSTIAIPSALAAAALIAFVGFLAVRRRKRSSDSNNQTKTQDFAEEIEGGLYSYDKSLASSRENPPDFESSSSVSGLGSSQSEDSIFSKDIKEESMKLQKLRAAASTATVPTSNMYDLLNVMKDDDGNMEPESPKLLDHPSIDYAVKKEPQKQEPQKETQSTGNVLADLARLASCRTPDRDTPRPSKSPSSNPRTTPEKISILSHAFQCTPTIGVEDEPETTTLTPGTVVDEDAGRLRGIANDKTPLVRNYLKGNYQDNTGHISGTASPLIDTNADTIFRSKTPENTRSRASTPNISRPSTPGQGNQTITPNQNRKTTPNRSRATTPNRSRATTPTNPIGGRGGQWVEEQKTPNELESFSLRKVPASRQRTEEKTPHEFEKVELRQVPTSPVNNINDNIGMLSGMACSAFGSGCTTKTPEPTKSKDIFIEGLSNEVFYPTSGRRHVGNNGVDGSAMYQANAMDPNEWSYRSYEDNASIGNSTISESDKGPLPRQIFNSRQNDNKSSRTAKSPGRRLINDLNWIEQKIADVRQNPVTNIAVPKNPPPIDTVDSLSYASNDNNDGVLDTPTHLQSPSNSEVYSSNVEDSVMSSIVCRDCYAPPGKLHIVIHSTKDGPAVHSVKQGSSLEGHVFPGDLIISVDDVDSRTFTAEHVMKMMAAKNDKERKITVLHFEEESQI
jgi:hypothetical protein